MYLRNYFNYIILILFIIIVSCKKEAPLVQIDESSGNTTPYKLDIPRFFPTNLNIPSDNPMTNEGVELGRYLYYDTRLSGRTDAPTTCASCHIQSNSFENGTGVGIGVCGNTGHVMLPHINLVWNFNGYAWNGSVSKLEDVMAIAIAMPQEMCSDTNLAKASIQSISMYPPMFKKAFGSEKVTAKNIGKAIAQFMRTLISSNSRVDRYLRGEINLTNDELNGYIIFNTEKGDCFHCHGTILFTTNSFYNNAKDTIFNSSTSFQDRFSYSGNAKDIGFYRAPTLRNIELTGPYMHDGRYKTLESVINHYSDSLVWSPYVSPLMKKVHSGGAKYQGANLTINEKKYLLAFLKALTDTSFINNKNYSNPFLNKK